MLKNNNKKFIKTLSDNCLKANKSRNRIAVLAIALTAVLFMALTTVFQGTQISMKNQMLRQAGSKFMVSIKNLTKEEAQTLVSNPAFTVAGMERYVSAAMNPQLNNIRAVIGWVDETTAEQSFMKLEEGHYPENENEIACDSEVLRLLGLPYEIGSTIPLQYTAGEEILEKEMTVCGIWRGMKYEQNASLLVSESFVEEVLKNCEGEYASLREQSYDVRGSFANEKNIPEKLDKLIEELGYDPYAESGAEGFLTHHVNPVYGTTSMDSGNTVVLEGIGVLLILLAGYLIIYNIFKISIEKDIRLYGQLKTIGTSPKQIRYMVTRQGMLLSAAGIPTGLILGWLLGNALLSFIMTVMTTGEFSFLIPSLPIWLLSGLFTLITVRISCSRPGMIAGKISPIEALKYHGVQKSKKGRKRGRDSRCRIAAMAVGNLSRNKGKTILVVLSISLSAVLLNSVLNYTGSMDKEAFVESSTTADFDVTNAAFSRPASEDYQKVVSPNAVDALRNLKGVSEFGLVYCWMLPEDKLTDKREDVGKIIRINQKETPEEPEEFDRNRMMYGYDETIFSKVSVIEGSVDYEKLCTGNYVVMAGYLNDEGDYVAEAQEFHAGDVIEVEIGGTVREYTVMAVVGCPASLLMSFSTGGYEAIVFAAPTFLEMFPDMQDPIHCLLNTEKDKFDEVNEEVNAVAESCGLSVSSRLTAEEAFREIKMTYSMVGIVVSLILGSIGILNLVNVILTGVIARQREFASMRSIGMTKRQLRKLVIYEGILYAALAGVLGIVLGGVLSVTLVKSLAAGTWFLNYHFTILPAVSVSAICILLVIGISAMTDKVWNKGSIVEQLRQIE